MSCKMAVDRWSDGYPDPNTIIYHLYLLVGFLRLF